MGYNKQKCFEYFERYKEELRTTNNKKSYFLDIAKQLKLKLNTIIYYYGDWKDTYTESEEQETKKEELSIEDIERINKHLDSNWEMYIGENSNTIIKRVMRVLKIKKTKFAEVKAVVREYRESWCRSTKY